MLNKKIKKYIPSPEKIKNIKGISFLSKFLHNKYLWNFQRRPVLRAVVIGIFWMSIPIPTQMLFAALSAVKFRANLPISIALVWISNPITVAPIFYFNYIIGSWLINDDTPLQISFELSWQWMLTTLNHIWIPLYLGSLVVGLFLAAISYFLLNTYWKYLIRKKKTNKSNEAP